MALADLNENSSTEEVQSYVEEVVKQVEDDRKSDAQITSEQAHLKQPADKSQDAQKTTVETPSDSDDTAEVEGQGEETGDKDTSWLDDDLKAEVAAYGIDESELADFTSREELERALRVFDKTALAFGRKALAEEETGRNEKGQFTKRDKKPKEEPEADAPKRDGQYEVTLDKDIYDDGIVEEFTRLRDHYETRLQVLESRFIESDARAQEQHFDQLVDAMGHTDLFGKTGSEDAKELQRRKDLHVAVNAQMIGLERLGRPAELNESFVLRVAKMVFAEELHKKDLKQRTRKISKQSNGRQGGGAIRPQDPREDPRDEADRLYRELERA